VQSLYGFERAGTIKSSGQFLDLPGLNISKDGYLSFADEGKIWLKNHFEISSSFSLEYL